MTVTNTEIGAFLHALTEDTTPDAANDEVMTYDASASAVKRVKLDNLAGGGGLADEGAFTYLDATDAAAPADPAAGYARIYSKAGRIYSRDSDGNEYGPFDAAGAGAGDVYASVSWWADSFYGTTPGDNYSGSAYNRSSGTATVPQDACMDLGSDVTADHLRVTFSDGNHSSQDGELQSSDDGSSWSTLASWTGDTSATRLISFTKTTARFWRIYTTKTGNPGATGVDFLTFHLYYGIDYAYGITPTSDISYTDIAYATDGEPLNNATANASPPSYIQIDLGAAQTIQRAHVVYRDDTHRCQAGNLQYSNDNATWSDATSVTHRPTGVGGLSFAPHDQYFDVGGVSARYWRFRTTFSGGNGVDYRMIELIG